MPKPIVRAISTLSTAERNRHSINRSRLNGGKNEDASCRKPIWISCFFDGTGNNFELDGRGTLDEDDASYSNVAKLWHFAHPKESIATRTYGLYIQGVGTPCRQVGDTGDGLDKATGMSTASKGEVRIQWMLRELKLRIDRHMPTISQINVAVFGFSLPAAQARAFVRMLGDQCTRSGDDLIWFRSGGAPGYPKLVVYFLGIFDTVASVGFGGSRMERKVAIGAGAVLPLVLGPLVGGVAGGVLHAVDNGGHAAWASDLRIPSFVRFCEHFIAAHEVREKFPCDSVREDGHLPGNCRETFYPGAHSDVGGGYTNFEQEGRTNELSRIPLCNMYLSAYAAGVPFFPPESVLKNAGTLFDISNELRQSFDIYMKLVPDALRLEEQCIGHMNAYYHWRWGRTIRQRDREKRRRAMVAKGQAVLSATPDRYTSITDADWEEDVAKVAAAKTGYITWSTVPHEDVLFEAWKGTLRKSLSEADCKAFDTFFDRYVHDSVAGFKNQMNDAHALLLMAEQSRWSRNRQYFLGKRDGKFIYWRYEGENPANAKAKVAAIRQKSELGADVSQMG